MKILIVGGGIGGLTLAAFLQNSNIEYEIIEKAQNFNWDQQGFIIGIWQNGRDILEKLGLAETFDQSGQPIRKYVIRNGKGKLLREYDFSQFYVEYGGAIKLIERAALHNWLLQKVDRKKITMGSTVEKIDQSPDRVTVTLHDGRVKEYDLVVGADGVHSSIRNMTFKKNFEHYINWRVWCVWVDKKFETHTTVSEYIEARELGVVMSSGSKAMAWLVAPADHTCWDSEENRVERLKSLFKEETALMPALLEKAVNKEIMPTDLIDVHLNKWFDGRVVLLGDAAHSFGPQAGIGGSMAMEDAYVLASELMRVSSGLSIADALKDYESKRKKRTQTASKLSHKLRRYVTVKSKFLRKTLDLFMPCVPAHFFTKEYRTLLKQKI